MDKSLYESLSFHLNEYNRLKEFKKILQKDLVVTGKSKSKLTKNERLMDLNQVNFDKQQKELDLLIKEHFDNIYSIKQKLQN